jgi:hypothetical protein
MPIASHWIRATVVSALHGVTQEALKHIPVTKLPEAVMLPSDALTGHVTKLPVERHLCVVVTTAAEEAASLEEHVTEAVVLI